jgi:hypothetical protein
VRLLAQLQPQVIASGHGQTMYGAEARKALNKLTRQFWEIAMPEDGRYVHEPALTNETGVTYIPPEKTNANLMALVGVGALAIALTVFAIKRNKEKKKWMAFLDENLKG